MRNLVGGEWLDAVEGEVEGVVNPATGETMTAVARGTEAEVHRAIEAATGALPEWLKTTPQERLLGFLERATGHGKARILTGGDSNGGRGFFVTPTVVVDVEQTDEIVQREVFGPVVTVQRFEDDDQAIAWANDVEYGLSALGLDARCRPRDERGAQPPVRNSLDQRQLAPRLGDAVERLQAVGLRQRHVPVRA
jgi:acyl-CoA reductase-like NAD-dependent aldehyde dehydrogenase